ncbi:MAG: hypothetical protein ACLU9S_08420 [Oscillospiraceae bacterium]
MVAIATCNYPETAPDCNGGSSVFDGVAYLPELEAPGTCASSDRKGDAEGIMAGNLTNFVATANLQKPLKCLPAPQKYGLLVDTDVKSPL